jgi:hypothetical protein
VFDCIDSVGNEGIQILRALAGRGEERYGEQLLVNHEVDFIMLFYFKDFVK